MEARPSINRLHLCAEFLTAMDSCDTERLIVHQDGSTATAVTASITASGGGSGGGAASATASTTSTRQQPSLLRLRRNTVYNNYHVIFLIRMYYSQLYLLALGCSLDPTTNSRFRFMSFNYFLARSPLVEQMGFLE